MKKIFATILMFCAFSALADIGKEAAVEIASKDAYAKLKLHFGLDSIDELKDLITQVQGKIPGITNTNNRQLKRLLKSHPQASTFYVKVELNDSVYHSMFYLIDKNSGKIAAIIYAGNEIFIE